MTNNERGIIRKMADFFCPCISKPCCMLSEQDPEYRRRIGYGHEKKDTFEIIYRTTILGHVGYIPIVGDSIFGYTVWEVDYYHRYAYVTD